MATATITIQKLYELYQSGEPLDLIDVRTPAEFEQVHIQFAENKPLNQLQPAKIMAAKKSPADKPLYIVCRSGARSQTACEQFASAGFPFVVNVAGGTLAWDEAKYPVTRQTQSVSIERQVRMIAGLLSLTGTALAYFVDANFLAIPALVGLGLFASGATNVCSLGMFLAKMPWNRHLSNASCNTK